MNKKKNSRREQPPPRSSVRLWLAAVGLVLLVAGGLAIFWTSSNSAAPAAPPEVTGAPKLAVDQAVIDEGYQKFDTPVRTAFRLRNTGDQPLQILGEPQVQLVEGC